MEWVVLLECIGDHKVNCHCMEIYIRTYVHKIQTYTCVCGACFRFVVSRYPNVIRGE